MRVPNNKAALHKKFVNVDRSLTNCAVSCIDANSHDIIVSAELINFHVVISEPKYKIISLAEGQRLMSNELNSQE